jgi:hypothetical protein
MSYFPLLTSAIRSRQTINSSQTVSNTSTAAKDFTISAVTDTSKCVLIPLLSNNNDGMNGTSTGFFAVTAGPTLTSTTNLRFAISSNSNQGDATLYCAFQIVEFY